MTSSTEMLQLTRQLAKLNEFALAYYTAELLQAMQEQHEQRGEGWVDRLKEKITECAE